MAHLLVCFLALLATRVLCAPYDPRELDWNLNTNQQAQHPLDYSGVWEGHNYTESPENWRFPFYTLFLDRFVNGDPSNDDINGTSFEHDTTSNQLRHGGDLVGLADSLDYLQGMGIKGIYIAGTPFLNLPYKSDQYSPIDFTVLDHHLGTITQWRAAIEEIHVRGMYVLLDNTGATMADLIGFQGYLNETTPFNPKEYRVEYKSNQTYLDFSFGNTYNSTCEYPMFWNESGNKVLKDPTNGNFSELVGCYSSEFDQYGDTEAFGVFPDWQRQLSKFASVQDRLREWVPSVREKIQHMLCLVISQLDIDGFRFDKATQMTPDAEAEIAASLRTCAAIYGKKNFFLPGEITGGNTFGSIYLGRGREPEMVTTNITEAVLTTSSDSQRFLRNESLQALDAAAFHYSIYRTLTRFLGMDGNLTAGYDVPTDFVDIWNTMLTTNDFLNANTGDFDPRHMYGTSNQDVFRWPAIEAGTDRMLLGLFITTLHMPGIPLLTWGEEQAFYVLDNTAENYVFGRQAMSSASAWQLHGCYRLNSSQYYDFPVDAALDGCNDASVSLDHRDPTHPVRNIIAAMYTLRDKFPVLNDGFNLQSLSKQTHDVFLPGSNKTATETGMWSVVRNQLEAVQSLDGNQSVWLVYQNDAKQVTYSFDCTDNDTALLAPFPQGTTVKNLLAPYEETKLQDGPGKKLFIDRSQEVNGCLKDMTLDPWGFKAYVPKSAWVGPAPRLTNFLPGYDARLPSAPTLAIELRFSQSMGCDDVTKSLTIDSVTEDKSSPTIDLTSVTCAPMTGGNVPAYGAYIASVWSWKGSLKGVADGVHVVTLTNQSSADHLMFRVGEPNNPMVFPQLANYSKDAYTKDAATGDLVVHHAAAGADKWRYSTNWGSSWSAWADYAGGSTTIAELPWSGTHRQKWSGDHVILQYWSKLGGSSDHIQHADANWSDKPPRRFPHLFAQGPYNLHGFDGGLPTLFQQDKSTAISKFHLSTEWPTTLQVSVWGVNPDGKPDQTFVYGDVDGDNVLDRLLPGSLAPTLLNLTTLPPSPYLAFRLEVDEGSLRYQLVPTGNRMAQLLVFALLWALPILTAASATWIYMGAFYKIKFNKIGISKKGMGGLFGKFGGKRGGFERLDGEDVESKGLKPMMLVNMHSRNASSSSFAPIVAKKRRTVLIATMEYDIEDWAIKIKIGGLGVMAQLMGKALGEQDLIWVVPCVGGIDYPIDQVAEPMTVTIMEKQYEVMVQYHQLRNITYVLLDAPVFRQQSKTEPYPPRMDDLDSAIYYSAWNACIAETVKRFPIDIYHINDYHGAAAPLYLLPRTIPCCLSLHNAEFQGLWPMRTKEEQEEVCKAFNLSKEIVEKYVQFGEVFNLLHAAASYLRVHQKGFGAVGVSNKYGPRSFARYPIFWGLSEIGKLPNPDPSDTEPWNKEEEDKQIITVDPAYEAARGGLRKQAQEWAHLKIDPTAELFVFVGRWSVQKGVDLIADVFPAVLDKHQNVQIICVGPVIDLHGKFAALKLEAITKRYPGRVYSKPEFTALPPYIFSGAEFALIPSRDEPFGLVAVEFGRKGALGVGARVGGLGQMPGWWFTVESTTTKHMIHQFKAAIEDALGSSTSVRAEMRARSAKQRFPVAKWVEDLELLQGDSIRIHEREQHTSKSSRRRSGVSEVSLELPGARGGNINSDRLSIYEERAPEEDAPSHGEAVQSQAAGLGRSLSLGSRAGPGHRVAPLSGNRLSRLGEGDEEEAEVEISREEAEAAFRIDDVGEALRRLEGLDSALPRTLQAGLRIQAGDDDTRARGRGRSRAPDISISAASPGGFVQRPVDFPTDDNRSRSPSPMARTSLLPDDARRSSRRNSNASLLSLTEVTHGRSDYNLQKIELNFTDTTGEYYDKFQAMLAQKLDAKSSESTLVIEDYLKESEKEWAAKYRAAKLGRGRSPSPAHPRQRDSVSAGSLGGSPRNSSDGDGTAYADSTMDEFLLGDHYVRPSFVKRYMQTRVFDWPIYSVFLAIGQIIAANSYQIVLLTGGSGGGSEAEKLYVVGGIYIIASCLWWMMYRTMTPRYVMSVPFGFYGLAFVLVGLAPFIPAGGGRDWARNIATGVYAIASASGSLFFALNFGDEGGAPIKSWVYRACLVQGIQQVYVVALFYWGDVMSAATAAGQSAQMSITNKPIMAAIACPIGALLLLIGVLLFTSLPPYYRQTPGKIPNFYHSLLRRRLILWMFASVALQNYFLSAPYGRNWAYLWSSIYAPKWAIAVLALVFFVGVWTALLFIFAHLSKSHSWILPMFAFGLLAPRWAQMWWGTSSYGLWLPWMPGGPVAGAIAGRSLWLWLGVLDAIQGVGIGMALLQTLTRIHVAVVLTASQVLGAAVTLIAKASAPDANGPGPVFPDLSAGVVDALMQPWFWVALVCQLVIPVGFFFFFRKEQLSKP
ncbi:hypothetical protein LTR36_010912 [Oleoguttula mirabilis]|uniref:alpha-1,3-glucan synthase n=1 Tax=Oleoguttula mirabilis TaxID=1507867 RepID=A0AAV9J3K6_9PEZI|nr:hypothetical protein LTR36_010912 [Oleoguttula mirabilis]